MTTEYGKIISYVNRTEQPHGMYAKISKEGAPRQCRNRRTATSGAMTGPGIMILLYGAGGEPGRGESPMSTASRQAADDFPDAGADRKVLRTLTSIIRREKRKEEKPMDNCKVIAVTNQKGGVGKTTTTVNLGAGLAMNGKRVLLIDADPQGSLTVSLGIRKPDELDVSLATVMQNVIEGRDYLPDEGILHHKEGMDLLPSNIELSGLETALFNVMSRETILKNCVRTFKRNYDYVLIDCMPSLGMMTINALAAADSVIIPTQPSFLSAKGMDLLFHSIAKVRRSINPELRIDGVLMTMVDGRTNNAREVTESLRLTVGQKIRIFDTEIPRSVRAAECSQEGKSIFAYDPKGKVAEGYRNLTKEVERIEEKSRLRSWDDRSR